MNDHELRRRLALLKPPTPNELSRHRALHRATIALSQMPTCEAPKKRFRWRGMLGRATGAVMVVSLVVLSLILFRSPDVEVRNTIAESKTDLLMLAQVEGLFPGQLNAVIERNGEMALDLMSRPRPGATDQALVVQLEARGNRLRVLSYSGRRITLELNGVNLTFEALVTSDGSVVLAGEEFVWSPAHPQLLAGYRVQARSLPAL